MGFVNGLFLAGTATALLPILIHLVQRRRVQEVIFGSLRFLQRTKASVVHRRRFEEILLVALRALALAALAVGFARPFFPEISGTDRTSGLSPNFPEGAVLVLLDHSYSMQAEGRLERAKEEALEFLRQIGPGTTVGVAAYSSQFDELCPLGSSPAQAEEAVKGLQPSWRGTKLSLALSQANRLLTRAARAEERCLIVLIGDFQESAWNSRDTAALAPGIELAIRNVGGKAVPNVFVERVAVPRLVVAGGFEEVISASIRNLSGQPLNDARVAFRVDGEVKGTSTVNIRPGEEASVRFRHKFTEPGDVTGSIAVGAEDGLPADNVACFCLHVTPRVHVLLVNADRAEKMVLNDGLFLKTALAPQAGNVVSPFELREIAPEEMKPADLGGVDVVLFANVSRLPAAVTEAPAGNSGTDQTSGLSPNFREFRSPLGRFLAAGGGIGFLCGSKVVPEEFNRTFDGLAPCKLSRLALRDGDPAVVINQTDARHEVFAEFAQPHSGDFSQAEFSQYFLVTDSLRAQVPARFSNRDAHPALLERVFGQEAESEEAAERGDKDGEKLRPSRASGQLAPQGKSALFVSSLDLEWNNLCLKGVFVPFVHQLTKRLCARRTGSVRNFVVGDEITQPVPKEPGQVTLRRLPAPGAPAAGPEGGSPEKPGQAGEIESEKPVELKVHPAGGGSAVTFTGSKPGLYELAYSGGRARFAIALDPKEPDLRPLDTKLLLAAVRKGPGLEGETSAGAVAAVDRSSAPERIEGRQKAWRYVVLGVLVLLALEMALATRIGRA